MLRFMLDFQAPVLLLFSVSAFVCPSLLLLFIIQKYLKFLIIDTDTKFGDIFTNSLAMIFGIIFGFIVVSVWESYNHVMDKVSKEANALHNMYRNLDAYPINVSTIGKSTLEDYAREVISNEWKLLSADKFDPIAYKKLREFYEIIVPFRPKDFGQLAAQQEMLCLISDYRELRRNRVENAKSILDTSMWMAFSASALLITILSCLFKTQKFRSHVIYVSVLASGLGIVLFLLLIYDHPFMGPSAITPEPFEKLLNFYWSNNPNNFNKNSSE